MSVFHSISDLIGHTPLLQLHKLDTGPCSLFLKLENQNPGGSIKDRVALSMINEAERLGKLKPGGTIIEATAGNTGLGLALIAAQKNYALTLVVPDKMSREKIFHLRALGAKVLLTRSDVNKGHPAYYQDYARRLAEETPGAFYIDQFNNEANPLAHATTTAPEIYDQLDGDIDAIVVGVGSGEPSAACRPGLPDIHQKPNLFLLTRRARSLPTRLKPGATVKQAPGWSKGLAKILSRRWPIWMASERPIASAMAKRSPPPDSFYKPRGACRFVNGHLTERRAALLPGADQC
jgi:threonine dehydratase